VTEHQLLNILDHCTFEDEFAFFILPLARSFSKMGKTHMEYLYGERVYGCKSCAAHFSAIESMISRAFQGQHGRAYLFDNVVNVTSGEPMERQMTTGLHVVRDIFCEKCKTQVGWKYDKAYNDQQKYKEGKFILERAMIQDVQ